MGSLQTANKQTNRSGDRSVVFSMFDIDHFSSLFLRPTGVLSDEDVSDGGAGQGWDQCIINMKKGLVPIQQPLSSQGSPKERKLFSLHIGEEVLRSQNLGRQYCASITATGTVASEMTY